MNKLKENIKIISFRQFAVLYTVLILIYLLIRAFYTEFLADETATYWYFIYRGDFHGENIVLDAANHPLNSFLGHISYLIFGDNKGLIRIWSILSYILYAIFSYKICKIYSRKTLQYLSFVALNSIPYMLEYFAYTRGYGLSMGFFMGSVYFLTKFVKVRSIKNLAWTYILGLIAYAANLTLMSSLFLIGTTALFTQILYRKNLTPKQHLYCVLLHLLLLLSVVPFIQFSFRLKEAGALYYSTLEGIWDMTGRTLTEYVLFYNKAWIMYVFILLFFVFIFILIKRLKSKGFSLFFQSKSTLFAILFFGNLVISVALAEVLKINYPSDRTGMYLIPLFLLLLFNLMEKVKFSEYLLLFFPISLICNLSIHTSVFAPDNRVTQQYFNEINQHIDKQDAVVIYKTMFANWLYLSSHKKGIRSYGQPNMEKTKYADIFLTKTDRQQDSTYRNPNLHLYHLIAKDDDANMLAYERNFPAKRTLVFSKSIKQISSSETFYEFLNEHDFDVLCNHNNLMVSVSGHFKIKKGNATDIVLTTINAKDELIRYYNYPLELAYQSQAMDDDIQVNFLLENIQKEEVKMTIYLWNKEKGYLQQVNDVKIEIFKLN